MKFWYGLYRCCLSVWTYSIWWYKLVWSLIWPFESLQFILATAVPILLALFSFWCRFSVFIVHKSQLQLSCTASACFYASCMLEQVYFVIPNLYALFIWLKLSWYSNSLPKPSNLLNFGSGLLIFGCSLFSCCFSVQTSSNWSYKVSGRVI